MSDRDRLVELLKEADDATEVHDCDYPTYEKAMQAFYTSIADYLLANGVIVPPCAVGDTVWTVGKNYNKCGNHYDCEDYDSEEYLITWCEAYCPNGYRGTGVIQGRVYMMELYEDKIYVGIDVERRCLREPVTNIFLTKEEAEAKLEELKGE